MADEGVVTAVHDPLRFAEKLLAILDTGRFTATYKFATLTALIDVCVESVDTAGIPPQAISARRVGRRVLELFWRHAIPYKADLTERLYLRHSSQRGDLVSRVTSFRERHHLGPGLPVDVAQQRYPKEFADLEDHVVVTVIRMPLPKLQRFGTGAGITEDRFLYDYTWPDEVPEGRVRAQGFDDTLYLQPGVGEWLVRLAGVLRPIVQQRWASFVADRSRDAVEAAWLDEFLFGSTRVGLDRIRRPLLEAQSRSCFYCELPARPGATEVDHFIPWARHPDNGLHNLVAAHRRCNNAKRDSLAAAVHLRAGWTALIRTARSCLTLDRSCSGRLIATVALEPPVRSTYGFPMGPLCGRAWTAIPRLSAQRFGRCFCWRGEQH
jgi:hypothetical protein